jgi:hypothetical protein
MERTTLIDTGTHSRLMPAEKQAFEKLGTRR